MRHEIRLFPTKDSKADSPLAECRAEGEASEGEDDRVAEDPDAAPGDDVHGRSDEADQAEGTACDESSAHKLVGLAREAWDGKQERQAEENVPGDDVYPVNG
jgi:hypothetical protein